MGKGLRFSEAEAIKFEKLTGINLSGKPKLPKPEPGFASLEPDLSESDWAKGGRLKREALEKEREARAAKTRSERDAQDAQDVEDGGESEDEDSLEDEDQGPEFGELVEPEPRQIPQTTIPRSLLVSDAGARPKVGSGIDATAWYIVAATVAWMVGLVCGLMFGAG